jgi:hypothetical protein
VKVEDAPDPRRPRDSNAGIYIISRVQGSPSEMVNGTFSLQGDVLTFTSADGKEIERYKREK